MSSAGGGKNAAVSGRRQAAASGSSTQTAAFDMAAMLEAVVRQPESLRQVVARLDDDHSPLTRQEIAAARLSHNGPPSLGRGRTQSPSARSAAPSASGAKPGA
ncbi:hypothetical protein CAL26_23425 [Bordetella genomosp. 9]|uniref:Uncharacterized protein n=1 Tax=Bordetella genomosp. 9 TaxID=1416803 RepID=A0A261R678_9BORD|nr:hypothetical protein [Bordetella genomosp. 9]OZI20451.1 hypothetical protein CAL26_23425 [Bordetella genomosp. 9]